jgi:hypothetical protein
MKRWIAPLIICAYLGSLAFGIVTHTLQVGANSHPAMYFVVWDMFCGWGAYSNRTHLVAEGESGKYYQLSPAPWGALKPFGNVDRLHYDSNNYLSPAMIRNNLRHTQHEPISRVFVVEEIWPKKFNLPDPLWDAAYDEPKDKHSYFHLRGICSADGEVVRAYNSWYRQQVARSVADNPRVLAAQQNSQPFYPVNMQDAGFINTGDRERVGSRMGN